MKGLIAAIQFITILPLGKPDTFEPEKMVPFFPVAGIIIGTMVSMFDHVVLLFWPQSVASMLDVVFLVVVTGAFHLDGLGDAADGLLGIRPKKKALLIMKDSRIGVMGLAAILCVLAVKWGGIFCLNVKRDLLLIIVPAYARSGMLFGIWFLGYGRPEGGTGLQFFNKKLDISAFWGLLIPVFLSIFLGWRGIWLNLIFILITVSILLFYKKRIGCITGDMLGAMSEIIEAMLFLLVLTGGVF